MTLKARLIPTLAIAALIFMVVGSSMLRPERPSARLARAAESDRIHRHLAGAEALLRRPDPATLTPAQRRARSEHIRRLHSYAERRVYPHNHDFEGGRRPYFVDRHGTLCAMAYLIAASGRRDIVDLVAQIMNNATVLELAADPEIGPVLAAWLRDAGMTVAEAQRVQPEYEYTYDPENDPEISTSFAVSSAAVSSLCLVATGMNSALVSSGDRKPWVSKAGLGMGIAGVILGGFNVDAGGPRRALATVDIAVGAAAILSSSWALIQAKHMADPPGQAHDPAVSFKPLARWKRATGPTLGLAVKF
jgi:hypothetical protein